MADPGGPPAPRVDVLGVPVDPLDIASLHARLCAFVRSGARATVLHANVHAINLACRHDWLRDVFRRADLVFCDGHGVRLAARLLGGRLPARITYADWTWDLVRWCEHEGFSLFLLGAAPGVADLAAARLRARHPRLRIVGTRDGHFDKTAGSPDTASVVAALNAAAPDLVIVGFGMPLQERWVDEQRAAIHAPVVLTGGAVFDYVSGRLRRPPRWMNERGLEWLGRLAIEPRRLASRYLVGNPVFAWRVLRERLRHVGGARDSTPRYR
jgi:N-acetylglucosaminyldiphosphoundecaprenol N-acetyl-beta-D-mannosaminyltransferase